MFDKYPLIALGIFLLIILIMKIAIYPGTFDPITNGHLDILMRSIKFVDKLIIAVSNNNKKKTLFNVSKRVEMIKKVIQDENISNVEVDFFDGL